MKHRRGVPGSTPEKMAHDLAMAYWKPRHIAEENLKFAKTSYQVKYWQKVVSLCPEFHA